MPAASHFFSGSIRVMVVSLVISFLSGVPVSGGTAPNTAKLVQEVPSGVKTQKLFIRGMTETYLEDYEEAVSLFEQALAQEGEDPAILSALAEAEAKRDNTTSAIYYARKARDLAPAKREYAHQLAALLEDADRLQNAVDVYQRRLATDPGDERARYALAQLYETLDEPERALRTYRDLLDSTEHPHPKARAKMLELYRELGDTTGVEHVLKELIQLRRNTTRYRHLLDQLYTERDRYSDAIPVFETLLEQDPADSHLLHRLTRLYTNTGDPKRDEAVGSTSMSTEGSPIKRVERARSLYEQGSSHSDATATRAAIDILQKVLHQAPSTVEALQALGTIRFDQEKYAAAASLFERAIDENPRAPDRWLRAARANLHADSLKKAVAIADEGQLLFPGAYQLLQVEAQARLQMGQPDAARANVRTALSKVDTSAVSTSEQAALYVGLARAHRRLENVEETDAAYRTALRLDSDNVSAMHRYAYHLANRGKALDRALELAQRAADLNESDSAVLGTLGWVYFQRKNYEAAKSAFERAVSKDNVRARVYEDFGDLQHALGNPSKAHQYWTKALKRAPHREGLREKLESTRKS